MSMPKIKVSIDSDALRVTAISSTSQPNSRARSRRTDSIRGSEPETLKKIAEGNWDDDVQNSLEEAVKQFAEDFGYDLDEEGHPLEEEGGEDREQRRDEGSSEDAEDAEDDSEEKAA